jgi:hypothetical protein
MVSFNGKILKTLTQISNSWMKCLDMNGSPKVSKSFKFHPPIKPYFYLSCLNRFCSRSKIQKIRLELLKGQRHHMN